MNAGEYLLQHRADKTLREIAADLGQTYSQVKHLSERMNLDKPYVRRAKFDYEYTAQDEHFITENYKLLTAKDLGKALNRSESAIKNKLRRMGLQKHKKNGKYHTGRDPWKAPSLAMAKWQVCHHSGLNTTDIPDQLAEIKLLQIQIKRHGKQILP